MKINEIEYKIDQLYAPSSLAGGGKQLHISTWMKMDQIGYNQSKPTKLNEIV